MRPFSLVPEIAPTAAAAADDAKVCSAPAAF